MSQVEQNSRALVGNIRRYYFEHDRGPLHGSIAQAFLAVDRKDFLPEDMQEFAYAAVHASPLNTEEMVAYFNDFISGLPEPAQNAIDIIRDMAPKHEVIDMLYGLLYAHTTDSIASTTSAPILIGKILEAGIPQTQEKGSFLEIGSGSGYVLALASEMGLYTGITGVEINPHIARLAEENIQDYSHVPIQVVVGDGVEYTRRRLDTWDTIIISAGVTSPDTIQELRAKLNPGGKLVAPVYARTETLREMFIGFPESYLKSLDPILGILESIGFSHLVHYDIKQFNSLDDADVEVVVIENTQFVRLK